MLENHRGFNSKFAQYHDGQLAFQDGLKKSVNAIGQNTSNATIRDVVKGCLQNDARLHSMNTHVVHLAGQAGLSLNPKLPPAGAATMATAPSPPPKKPAADATASTGGDGDGKAKTDTKTDATPNQTAAAATGSSAPRPKPWGRAGSTTTATPTKAADKAPPKSVNLADSIAPPTVDVAVLSTALQMLQTFVTQAMPKAPSS